MEPPLAYKSDEPNRLKSFGKWDARLALPVIEGASFRPTAGILSGRLSRRYSGLGSSHTAPYGTAVPARPPTRSM